SGRMVFDRALMRNPFMYEMFRQMGRWAPRTRFVEVFMNLDGDDLDANDYYGVYAFMEKIKIADDRLQITPADGGKDGGYIVKVDRTSGVAGDKTFSAGGDTFVWVEPQGADNVTTQQNNGLKGYMDDAIEAMKGDDPENPETGYRTFIDTQSWIDEYLARTLTRDPDGLRLSTYLYQPVNGKLFYSPIWDFDRTMGCDSDARARDPKAWVSYFANQGMWKNLLGTGVNRKGGEARMPEFWQEWIDRYHELRRTVWAEENMNSIIDSMAAEIREGQVRNFERWASTRPPGDRSGAEFNGGDDTWEGEVTHLKGWLKARVEWMDEQFAAQARMENFGLLASGDSVRVKDGGTLFTPQEAWYTTDGTDPRLPGGEVHPSAVLA
ncbi:MAG: CotH kinase family protein, partial [Verrucomicrobiales bacterium]